MLLRPQKSRFFLKPVGDTDLVIDVNLSAALSFEQVKHEALQHVQLVCHLCTNADTASNDILQHTDISSFVKMPSHMLILTV